MQTLKFKTSLKCNGCVNAIKPNMDAIDEINAWRVYLDIQEKILEVDYEGSSEAYIVEIVKNAVTKAGYSIEKIQ